MKNTKNKVELLAPGGNLAKVKTALAYDADAVYLGVPDFSLRVRINDFNLKTLKEAVDIIHEKKKKVYVTINIFAHNFHIDKIKKYLSELKKIGPDALIISDPGIIALVKKYYPKIDIHLSTQANCTNYEAVKFWYKQGVKRIVLGREVTLKEIKEIKKECPKMELEYFIHGAMCMSYSGRCFLSKDFVDRSANLGDCVQPCRWEYDVFLKPKGHDKELELVAEKHGSYLLNSKDLCLVRSVQDLIKAGITSFKIEGRAKSVYYLANIIAIYKRAIKEPKKISYLYKELKEKITNRGYTDGFLLGAKAEQNTENSHTVSNWEFCGQVLDNVFMDENGKYINNLKIKVHNTIKEGDKVEIVLPDYEIVKIKVNKIIDPKSGDQISEAHGGGGGQEVVLTVKSDFYIPELSVLRRLVK
ncbi:MAG: U32 family peptidase C-terminal domain-containing protein [Patescibacteria group bacterium]